MFGTFQHSCLRIEIAASADQLRRALTHQDELQQWLKFQRFPTALPTTIEPGVRFLSLAGGILPVQHQVELVEDQRIRFLLSQGIDGFHEWGWGDGWVQSRLEGVSLLPINLGQTLSLLCLKRYLEPPQSCGKAKARS